ncbi:MULTISPECIES: peptidylprolyl isomerase [Burkholderia cepacia complex]|uniref:peptidylprolyl isomerase n=1 Tax=Burkholderia cepacia complex TaxID=87882 RepID=UPI00098E98B1|nr:MULTISPECIES: peptidylprolyl isomerase [Burkholderia cepacia complex]AQT51976.1 peptidylprolyl isomerase [Burkholderia cenocepacia]MDN7533406.1 peptidylprolyl isomerase [Burkholderia orbicola]
MKMKTRLRAAGALIAIACAAGAANVTAAESQPLPKGVMAVVNDVPIPQSEFDSALKSTGQADTPELRARVMRELVVRQLIGQAADKANYGSRPEVQSIVTRVRTDAASDFYLRDTLRPQPVTDAQVKARYDAIVATAGQFDYRAEVIAVNDVTKANAALAKLKQGVAFDAVAKEFNTTANGGVAQWLSLKTPLAEGQTAGLPMPVAQAIAMTPVGATTGPIQIGNAFAIVKLDEKRKTVVPSFDQSKGVLRQQLAAQANDRALATLIDKLAAQATIRP